MLRRVRWKIALTCAVERRFSVGRQFGASPVVCCSFVPSPDQIHDEGTSLQESCPRERQLRAGIPRRVSAFLVCQGACYCGTGVALAVWPGWVCRLLLTVGLGGPDATGDSASVSSAGAGMIRIAAVLLTGVGWLYIHGGLSERLHFLAATGLNRAVFVPFMTTMLAILGAHIPLCVLFGVLDPVLTMLTYLVLLGCMDASRFCFKLLLPTIVAIAATITGVVAVAAVTTTYDTSLRTWMTVQICAMVFAMAVVTSLCLSSLSCVSGSTPPHASAAQNGSTGAQGAQTDLHDLPMFEGTAPVVAAEPAASVDVAAKFGATPSSQVEGAQTSGNFRSVAGSAAIEHDEHYDHSDTDSEMSEQLFEAPAPQRTSSSGIFSPPPPRSRSQRESGQEQTAARSAQ